MPTEEKGIVKLAEGAEENGLAQMLYDLLDQNLKRVPAKQKIAQRIKGSTYIKANDINVDITVDFDGKGQITIYSGKKNSPILIVETDSITIVDLSRLKVRWGIPIFFDEVGLNLLKKILTGKVKISGMLFHPIYTLKLLNVFSVM